MSKPTRPQPPSSARKTADRPAIQQKRNQPVAPPTYRPQPTPKVLQRKAAVAQPPKAGATKSAPAAPPVYRPQSAPKTLQPKAAAPQMSKSPAAPPVYRPQPAAKVLQPKIERAPQQPPQLRQTLAPPARGAQSAARGAQPKMTRPPAAAVQAKAHPAGAPLRPRQAAQGPPAPRPARPRAAAAPGRQQPPAVQAKLNAGWPARVGSVSAMRAKSGATIQPFSSSVIQLGVWKEGGKNAVAVPAAVKTLAGWIKSNISKLVNQNIKNRRQMMVGAANKWVYDRFKNQTYVGGDPFNNNAQPDSSKLPTAVTYTEWDVNPYIDKGVVKPRGAERIVIGSDGVMYYTADHYTNFTEFE